MRVCTSGQRREISARTLTGRNWKPGNSQCGSIGK